MKKLYTFALAVATIATASAATKQTAAVKYQSLPVQQEVLQLPVQAAKTAAVDFASIDEVSGEYNWSYYGLLNGDSGASSGVVTITVTSAIKGEVTIDGIFSAGTGITGKIKGTVDLKAGTLTLANNQNLGPDSYGDTNYFYLKDLDEEGDLVDGASAAESVVATIEGKSFVFPELCVFAIGDPNNEGLGWWKLTAMNSFGEYSAPDDLIDLSEWKPFSTATMLDGWVIPGLKYNDGSYADGADFPLDVTVYQHNQYPELFAIANPYTTASGFPLSGGEEGYIVIDTEDPEFVLVYPNVFTGYTNGSNRVYALNVEGFYVDLGYTKEVIQASLTDIKEWSNYKVENGKTTISIPTCRFNFPNALDKLYSWNGRAEAMKATITINADISGVKDVIASDDSNAPVEYYNLQGVRVSQPAAGQLLIKKQGNTVSKVLVK